MTRDQSLVVIDSQIITPQFLAERVVPGTKVLLLDPEQDAIAQITETLNTEEIITRLHLISHGSPGCLYLGKSRLNLETLANYAPQLKEWSKKIQNGILLYGCQVAAGEAGDKFLEKFQAYIDLPIAASNSLTGSALKHGNWDLEIKRGSVDSESIFLVEVTQNYSGVFSAPYLIEDINPVGNAELYNSFKFTVIGETLFFRANDGINGLELWKSDGTTEGTQIVANINPSGNSSPLEFTVFGETLFFRARDSENNQELWKSDGTTNGTQLVAEINPTGGAFPDHLTVMGETLFFEARDGINGSELWRTDGTVEGTHIVVDLNSTGSSYPGNLTAVGETLYFRADDGIHGIELWKSDGTAAGTQMVTDINPTGNSIPRHITVLGDTVFFTANDGIHGIELWKSDGTAAGTQLVADINPLNNSSGVNNTSPRELTIIGETLFFRASDSVNGVELWKSDGTAAGTQLVTDINPTGSSNPLEFRVLGETLFFSADDGTSGTELWKSDGTAAGTQLVADINPTKGSFPVEKTVVGQTLFFSADDGVLGAELWKSDGTAAGTQLVANINQFLDDVGPFRDSSPRDFTVIGETLFFMAFEDTEGRKLWGLNLSPDANDDVFSTYEQSSVHGNVLINDDSSVASSLFVTELNGSERKVGVETILPSGALLNLNADGTFIYAPNSQYDALGTGESTIENFTYKVQDENGFSNTATVEITIQGQGKITGTDEGDLLFGTLFDDTLDGGKGNDIIAGKNGNDRIKGGRNNDEIFGNQGDDTVLGEQGADSLNGGEGRDFLSGGNGRDFLVGGDNDDILRGGDGSDTLDGGKGNNRLIGGNGRDKYILRIGDGVDTILHFEVGRDSFLLDNLVFEDLSIRQGAKHTLISIAESGDLLARIIRVDATVFQSDDFSLLT